MVDLKLDDVDFKQLAVALRKMHRRIRELEQIMKRAELAVAQAKVDGQLAIQEMRETLDQLADKYGFDPDVPYELDYQTKSLVSKK